MVRSIRDALLDAALELFSQNGYNAVSMRAIAKAAHANVGSLTYHFGSKANLVREIYRRHTGPMNDRRMELLGEALRIQSPDERLTAIIRAYVVPAFSMSQNTVGGGARFTRMRAILSTEGNRETASIIADSFDDISLSFLHAIGDCVPGATLEALIWCSQFLLGALYYALTDPGRVSRLSNGEVDGYNQHVAVEQLVAAGVASFRNLSGAEQPVPV